MRNFLYDVVYYRDAHFVIGEEDEKKSEEDDKIVSDPKYVTFTLIVIQVHFSRTDMTRESTAPSKRSVRPGQVVKQWFTIRTHGELNIVCDPYGACMVHRSYSR